MHNQNDNLEKQILFDTKEEALSEMTLSEHINRLNDMKDYLNGAVFVNKGNLSKLKEVSKAQTSQLQTAYQILQSQTRQQFERLKKIFEPAMNAQKKHLSDMKTQVSKINSQQLSTKKQTLNCQALIDHCENEMGYVEMKNKNNNKNQS